MNKQVKQEAWRWVVGHEGDYSVSNLGRVASFLTHGGGRRNTPVVVKQRLRGNNYRKYWCIRLWKDGLYEDKLTHILVLEAFNSQNHEGLFGLHKDDNPDHNWLDNLEWGTSEKNREQGHDKFLQSIRKAVGVLSVEKVKEARTRFASGESSIKLSEDFGVKLCTMRSALAGRLWK